MNFFSGIKYNLRGLWLGIKTPRLLLLGIARFAILLIISAICIGLVLSNHSEVLNAMWSKPESMWIVWLWHLLSWLLALLLIGISTVIGYIISQLLFSVMIMDAMSRITEKMQCGKIEGTESTSVFQLFLFLIKQELPRAILPVLCLLVLMVIGWLTPAGPVISLVASCIAVIFLAWDNTDLTPARRMVPFRQRFKSLLKTLPFHLGFGLWFLMPILNILFLSFAPIGATLYCLEADNTSKRDS
jgi:CysZ protein